MANECLDLMLTANDGRLSEDDLIDILEQLQGSRTVDDLFREGRHMSERIAEKAAKDKLNAVQNEIKRARIMAQVDAADAMIRDPMAGLHAAMAGINAPIAGANRSVDYMAKGIRSEYMGGLVFDLEQAKVLKQFNGLKGADELEVAFAMADLNRKVPSGVKVKPDNAAIAKVLHKFETIAMERENRAGAFIKPRQGYVMTQRHDSRALRKAGFKEWDAFMAAHTKMDAETRGKVYVELESGIRDSDPVSMPGRPGGGDLAERESEHRVIRFDSVKSEIEYARMFGIGSLREGVVADLESAAQATAMMQIFGSKPKQMVFGIDDAILKRVKADPKKRAKARGKLESTEALWAEISGEVNRAVDGSATFASVSRTIRALQTMAKLGSSLLSQFSDLGHHAANRAYWGRTLTQSWADAFSAPFRGLSSVARKDLARHLATGIDGMLGDYHSRFNAADTLTGKTARAMQLFFKLNLVGPWTDAMKRGAAMLVSADLAHNAGKGFDALGPDMKRILGLYGIDAVKWDVARQAVKKVGDREYLIPGVLDDLGIPKTMRDEVKSALFALIHNEADVSIPTPGARERAIMRRGHAAGTAAGEALRFMAQFKAFAVSSLTKSGGRHVYGKGAKTLRAALLRGEGNMLGIVNVIVGSTILGYFSMQAKEIVKGREPRPASWETLLAAMAQGGGLGIYGDFLFGQANRFGGGPLESLAGPVITEAIGKGGLLDLFLQVKGGDFDVGAEALAIAKRNIPFANLLYTKMALDYLLWYHLQEAINPGYLRRMERRVKQENGQEYWLQPSATVAKGGGF